MSSMVDHDKRWVFIHVPRTAGTAVCYALQDHFEDNGLKPGIHTHRKLSDFQMEWWKYFKFSVVRNPWDMCVSWWRWHRQHCNDRVTLDFAVDSVERPIIYDMDRMDFVLRFEHLREDFAELCEKLEIETPFLKVMNASKHSNYRRYFNDELRERVADRFSWCIERFGYEF